MWLTSSTAADLDDPVAGVGVEAGGLGVEHDLTHARRSALIRAINARTSARAASMPRSVSMTKSARARFSASGICRARMRSSAAAVMPGRASTRARCTSRRRGHDEHAVEPGLGAGLEEQRDVEEHEVGAGVRREEGRAVGRDQRMDARLDPRQERRVGDHRVAQRGRGRPRRRRPPRARGRPAPPRRRRPAA